MVKLNRIFSNWSKWLGGDENILSWLLRSGGVIIAVRLLAMALNMVTIMLITRYYGAGSMGVYSIVNSYMAVVLIFSLMGMDTAALRLIPEYRNKYTIISLGKLLRKMLTLVCILSLCLSFVGYLNSGWIATLFRDSSEGEEIIKVASLFIMMQAFGALNTNIIRGLAGISEYAIFQILVPAIILLILAVLTFYDNSKLNPVIAMLLGLAANAIITIVTVYIKYKKLTINNKSAVSHNTRYRTLSELSFYMFMTSGAHAVISQVDILFLGAMRSAAEVGIYAVAVKLSILTSFVLSALNVIVAPKFSEMYFKNDMQGLKSLAQNASKLMFVSTIPIITVFLLFGKFLLGLFGAGFEHGYHALLILMAGHIVNSLCGPVGYFLNMTENHKQLNIIVLGSGLLVVVLNYVLIPEYGIEGAAAASAIGMILWNISASIYQKYKFGFYIGYLPIHFKANL